MKAEVSVCIPLRNCRDYIRQAIDSVLAQTYPDFELIILNNASTDGSGEVIRRYRDSRIRIIENQQLLPMAENWNKVVSFALGTYVKLLPADDLIHPDCLDRQLAVFRSGRYRDLVLVSCLRDIIAGDGRRLLRRGACGDGLFAGLAGIRKNIHSGTNLIGEPGAVLFKREIFRQVGGYTPGESFMIDLDLWYRFLLRGTAYVIPEALCSFRVSGQSISVRSVTSQRHEYMQFARRLALEKDCPLNRYDLLIAWFRSGLNNLLRYFFYRLYGQ